MEAELLGRIVKLISLDVESVESINATRFAPEVSGVLVRYLQGLSGAIKVLREKDEDETDNLSKLSNEELKAKAKELMKGLK